MCVGFELYILRPTIFKYMKRKCELEMDDLVRLVLSENIVIKTWLNKRLCLKNFGHRKFVLQKQCIDVVLDVNAKYQGDCAFDGCRRKLKI